MQTQFLQIFFCGIFYKSEVTYMPKKDFSHFLRIFRWVYSLSLVVCGVCLMGGCLSIYRSGDSPYSREAVAAAFSKIAIPVYLCLGLTIVNVVLALIFPTGGQRPGNTKDLRAIAARFRATRDTSDPATAETLRKMQYRRQVCCLISAIALGLIGCGFLVYALNGSHFHNTDINGSMVKAMYWLLPCLVLAFAVGYTASGYYRTSLHREIDLLKALPKAASPSTEAQPTKKCPTAAIIRLAVIVLGVGLIVWGATSGGIADVLTKANNICTECIGLG